MKRSCLLCLLLLFVQQFYGQTENNLTQKEVQRMLGFLASDSLRGRGNETKDLQKAAYFIEEEFTEDSLQFFGGAHSYLQPFSLGTLSENQMQKDSSGRFLSPKVLFNVIGVLPGKSLPQEAIIFSAHYDHIGVQSWGRDSICNGANDDASGTTALLMLARYYAQRKDNARTLIFCAFAAEELGLIGSQLFAKTIHADKIIAGVNIEMIGRTNATGKNAFFMTGSRYSNLFEIFKKNLKPQKFKIVSEPDFRKQLFMRSDNYSFAQLGIPAHTIMCSDDDDPCYHRPCDEVRRIDITNMTNVIKALAVACSSVISGEDTPVRIDPKRF